MATKQKLELTWIGKENRPRLEPRILLEDPARSYHAAHRVAERDCFDNRLIFGDNLLALKALEAEFTGKVKCVFIDPPYNTGSAFTHYDDGVEHSIWLSLMRDRLEIIRRLLSEDGSLWITIDDNECHYLNIVRFLDEVEGFVPWTWWPHEEVGHTDEAKKEMHGLFGKADPFLTPKPERLMQRVLHIATNPGDLVLDSFAGSGTTGAVAHKMGRRWIMVELGEHCHTHIIPRLKKVIDNDDPGGITKAVGWKGGGGFRYYRLAPSLLEKDTWGNWVINHDYNAAMLTEALCKLEGFSYAPSDSVYWQHGHSTERDFVYVTTASLTHEQLAQLSDEVGPERSLLVLCTSFRARADLYSNLTVKKIPRQVLSRCEWGHDDYSLRVENLPSAPPTPGQMDLFGPEELP
ncbi:site-specific DNA-methyltransferase [Candidatus Thiodictyon syntrophicum]|jgi:hypothetical protein|uniref:site-specific DNA-methyltransferase (adenine-specific) n=1 Tax=Candidatus Thiodictyon syntrophicum TaxID=1166950 RepID=A0A2K8U5H6_9GAMM|nr:site-specific DNA-methyltransferase [Candidatus Thiodictyon syntrophicum]AUB80834.1 hypothetical protein THSYN_07635 [Candidatus Thiodictyon syntrophicum]